MEIGQRTRRKFQGSSLYHDSARVGTVYFLWATSRTYDAVKIGFSSVPDFRIPIIQGACPLELRLVLSMPGTLSYEKYLHKRFSAYRIRGEWFELCLPIVDFIRDQLGVRYDRALNKVLADPYLRRDWAKEFGWSWQEVREMVLLAATRHGVNF